MKFFNVTSNVYTVAVSVIRKKKNHTKLGAVTYNHKLLKWKTNTYYCTQVTKLAEDHQMIFQGPTTHGTSITTISHDYIAIILSIVTNYSLWSWEDHNGTLLGRERIWGHAPIAVPVSRCVCSDRQHIFPQICTASNLDSNESHFLGTLVIALVYACQVTAWVVPLNTMILYASTKVINFGDGN
jgi:hypothetical protein